MQDYIIALSPDRSAVEAFNYTLAEDYHFLVSALVRKGYIILEDVRCNAIQVQQYIS